MHSHSHTRKKKHFLSYRYVHFIKQKTTTFFVRVSHTHTYKQTSLPTCECPWAQPWEPHSKLTRAKVLPISRETHRFQREWERDLTRSLRWAGFARDALARAHSHKNQHRHTHTRIVSKTKNRFFVEMRKKTKMRKTRKQPKRNHSYIFSYIHIVK